MRKRLAVGLVVAALVIGAAPVACASTGTAVATTGTETCTEVRLPAALGELRPKNFILAGTLCEPARWARGPRTVDILVHGGMYNRSYWDWPVRPEVYSYARRTLAAGRATFFYDRFGAGRSSRPAGAQASFNADVYGLHQIVGWLRGRYPAVNSIGHSLGSVVVAQEAGKFNDTDRVVITGLTHGHGLGFITLPTAIYTATLDPQFAADIAVLDGGYLTTLPGKRAGLFYGETAEPAVIAWDEAHKDVMTGSQTSEAIAQLSLPPLTNWSNQISAPVLMVNGQQDAPFCNIDVSCRSDAMLTLAEAPYFTRAQSFTARTVPDTAHNLPLHPSAATSFAVINTWLTETP